jgi:hypothetical protein
VPVRYQRMIEAGEAEPVEEYFMKRNRFLRALPVHDASFI